jgi:hypothetical protein
LGFGTLSRASSRKVRNPAKVMAAQDGITMAELIEIGIGLYAHRRNGGS